MAEPRREWRDTDRQETIDPRNPPNAVLNPKARSTALWAYLGPVVALFIIVGIVLVYWMTRDRRLENEPPRSAPIGTSGVETPGGHDPDPHPRNTEQEIEQRGTTDRTPAP